MFSGVLLVLMPVIATVAGVKIYIYLQDHNPPHFHARHDGKSEMFDLDGNTMEGKIDKKKRGKVKKWAKDNQGLLREKWDEYK